MWRWASSQATCATALFERKPSAKAGRAQLDADKLSSPASEEAGLLFVCGDPVHECWGLPRPTRNGLDGARIHGIGQPLRSLLASRRMSEAVNHGCRTVAGSVYFLA